ASGEQRLGVHLHSGGLGDIGLEVTLDSTTHVEKPLPLPELHARGRVRADANLLTQEARLLECTLSLGEASVFELVAGAKRLFAPSPEIALDRLMMMTSLDELRPLVAAAMPGTDVGGKVRFEVAPFTADLASLQAKAPPSTTMTLSFDDVSAKMPVQ